MSFCHIPGGFSYNVSGHRVLRVEKCPNATSRVWSFGQECGSLGEIDEEVAGVQLEIVEGNIVFQTTEAIVNAAHPDLLGGQGVDGAIHFHGGPQILEECRHIGGCPVGEAVITTGGKLVAKYVIHTVGPVFDPYSDESPLLACAYRNSLRLAADFGIRTIAFPSISTGAFCFPYGKAAQVALATMIDFLENESHDFALVRMVIYDRESHGAFPIFVKALRALLDNKSSPVGVDVLPSRVSTSRRPTPPRSSQADTAKVVESRSDNAGNDTLIDSGELRELSTRRR